ncbi:FAD-dependent monooxygenase [Pseudenhygromyxa sp. WMMC2535]|uniref:FAD-dependent monooxygenase n=1 Tax=Pseudenhygromyxa sp. WMMC2535 TaxID=2712867 RepID=UPI001555632B|nr:FAD-dependent monooxygenase [Pseudenhygromyxa sp. WMMC2535]NVB38338.1 FAD-dependent monooxygenase [Pseudenhygromyxa sp. WMMC2535]
MSARHATILIAGGGIGGMALALSLHAAGFEDVHVFESASATRELGVGINLLPHAVRELDELGLLARLETCAVETSELAYYSRWGQRIWSEPRGLAAGYRWPQLSILRGRLLGVLHHAVLERLGPERVHHAQHLDGFEVHDIWGDPRGKGVRARFVDRHGEREPSEREADVLVGCDGLRSRVRALLALGEAPSRWTGVSMWRGVTLARPFLDGKTMIMAGRSGHRVTVYPVDAGGGGRTLLNWVVEDRGPSERLAAEQAAFAEGELPGPSWERHAEVDADELCARFSDIILDFLDCEALIRSADAVYHFPMVDFDPLPAWTRGRVTLLGDAAHPMFPAGSNGSSQAILDARILARALALAPDLDAGLVAYEATRRPATAKIVVANREHAPERCMDLADERAPHGFARVEEVFAPGELEAIAENYKRTAGFSVATLNARPSLSVQG